MNEARRAVVQWRRGLIRLWLVLSAIWVTLALLFVLPDMHVAWPWVPPAVVHIKISDTQTWDYPAELGVERIKNDLKRRIAATLEDPNNPFIDFLVPTDWQSQMPPPRIAIAEAAEQILPVALGPPFAVLILGAAFAWALAGFRRT
jgi:hypothetical protein